MNDGEGGPSDLGRSAGSPDSRSGHKRRTSTRTVLTAAVVVTAAFLLLSPFTSPFAFLRDSDGDGHADSSDMYPDDPCRWDDLLAYGHHTTSGDNWTFIIETLSGASRVPTEDLILTVLVYDDGTPYIVQAFIPLPLSTWEAADPLYGIAFIDAGETEFFDVGDSFVVEEDVHGLGAVLWLGEDPDDFNHLVGAAI